MIDRLNRDRLVGEAIERAGSDDFGEPTWSEGLDRLLHSFVTEANLNEIGVEVAANDVVTSLANRLGVIAWRKAHPEVADGKIEQPIIIIGQPRTGTTILFDLLGQDSALRAPLTWEVDRPVPPPEPATYDTDPRIEEVQATLEMTDLLIPGFLAFHPMGARLAQECVRITGCDFRSMIFPTVYDVPSYNSWLLHEADLAPAYRWHRIYLQHLQSKVGGHWLLKSPAHLWHLDALAAEYPDAVLVQTHRDPLKVIASVSALTNHLRRMASDQTSVARSAAQYSEDILLGLERGMDARDRGVFPESQIVDVQFAEFMADPFQTIGRLYDQLGRELTAETESRMRAFLDQHPGDGGASRYTWAATELDEAEWRPRVSAYQQRYGVPSERLV
ncbi:MAG: sulfotransferase [Frankiaceae bacterium]|nr:sulfotransferase [Frankiaceae bacterium]MBV9871407.1 sulfotransferase [Frankiaceae bacterium]